MPRVGGGQARKHNGLVEVTGGGRVKRGLARIAVAALLVGVCGGAPSPAGGATAALVGVVPSAGRSGGWQGWLANGGHGVVVEGRLHCAAGAGFGVQVTVAQPPSHPTLVRTGATIGTCAPQRQRVTWTVDAATPGRGTGSFTPGVPASAIITTRVVVHAQTSRVVTRFVAMTIRPYVYYVALGDSVPVWNGTDSYPNQIQHSYVARRLPTLQLVNLACSSETTSTMIGGGICSYPEGSQYRSALRFLASHRSQIALITIDIGGNDLVACVLGPTVDQDCVQHALPVIDSNLAMMLVGLRAAAAPTTPIVGMNYYDPLLGDWLQGSDGEAFARDTVTLLQSLNGRLAGTYGKIGAPIANVQDAFHATDLSTLVSSQWGTAPIGVARACTWLDIFCQPGQWEGFGDDPNAAGATVIARAFESVIPTLRTRPPPG